MHINQLLVIKVVIHLHSLRKQDGKMYLTCSNSAQTCTASRKSNYTIVSYITEVI